MVIVSILIYKDPNQLISIVSNELTKVSFWLRANNLSLDLSKAHATFFHPRPKKISVNGPLVVENIVI